MSWFNVDDKAHSDHQFRSIGLDGFGLYAAAGSYCMDHLTDGFVPDWFVKSWPGGVKAAKKLVADSISVHTDDGYQNVEWKEALTRKYAEARKEKWRKDKQQFREEHRRVSESDSTVESEVESRTTNTNTNVQSSCPGIVEQKSGTSPAHAREDDLGTWRGAGPDPYEEYR